MMIGVGQMILSIG